MKTTYSRCIALFLALASFLLATPVLASDEHGCVHEPTIQALRDCVAHASNAGHIDNQGVTQSLVAKLDAAQAALDRGQPTVAANTLKAFVQTVEAQAGKHIAAEHAEHLVMHARQVLDVLR
jgi:hypothetical protein